MTQTHPNKPTKTKPREQSINNPETTQSQAIKANGQIFVSGQIPADANANLIDGSIGDKTQACCDNIKAILDAAGSNVQKIVKVNVRYSTLSWILVELVIFGVMDGG